MDPMGQTITDLRNGNVASGRVRGGEPQGKTRDYEGDALDAGHYKRFVVLSVLGRQRLQQAPVQEVRLGYRAYGVTFQDAAALALDVGAALHLAGGRSAGAGWIYQSVEEEAGAATTDPDTKQPYESGVIVLVATI